MVPVSNSSSLGVESQKEGYLGNNPSTVEADAVNILGGKNVTVGRSGDLGIL